MTPELKRALRQLGMTLPEAQAFVKLLKRPKCVRGKRGLGYRFAIDSLFAKLVSVYGMRHGEPLAMRAKLTPQGRFVAEALVRLGVGRKP